MTQPTSQPQTNPVIHPVAGVPPPATPPATPPVTAPAPAPAPQPPVPFAVFVLDNTGQGGIPLAVISANIKIARSGALPTRGSVELQALLTGPANPMSLMGLASKPGPYTLLIKYTGHDGVVIREDAITIGEGSQAEYTGPAVSKDGDSWEFIETLVIHAA